MINIQKKMLFLTIVISIIIFPIKCYADYTDNSGERSNSSTTTTSDNNKSSKNSNKGSDTSKETCGPPTSAKITDKTTGTHYEINEVETTVGQKWKAYDIDGNVVESVVAGTRFMANLEEYKKVIYKCSKVSTITYYYKEKIGSHQEEDKSICEKYDDDGVTCITYGTKTVNDYSDTISQKTCTVSTTSCDETALNNEATKKEEKVTEDKKDFESTLTVQIPDANDSNCTKECNITTINNPTRKIATTIDYSASKFTIEVSLSYEMSKTCINVKTGKIRYLNNSEECEDDEQEVPKINNDSKQWNVFTPLNMKSNETFTINILSNTEFTADECKAYIENHKGTYMKEISPNSNSFTGKYNTDLNKVKNGCKWTDIQMKVKILQKFYNEETTNDEITFKGFNFTYRPIDINDPFPNGIEKDSYWYNYDEDEIKISSSFEEKTYTADIDDASTIRELSNENNEEYSAYNNWTKYMNVDGTSNFIEKLGIVTREENISFYKLGCGPLNSVEKIDGKDNPLYQSWCKEVTTK